MPGAGAYSFDGGYGGAPTNYDPRFGGIPTVPSPGATASGAIHSNIGNLAGIYGLTTGIDPLQARMGAEAFTQNVPGLAERARGEVPEDVINELLQAAAERGIMTGSPGGPGANAAYLRSLGLTSLGLQTESGREIESGISRAPLFDPSSMFVTPAQQQEAQLAQNIYRAAPVPAAAHEAAIMDASRGAAMGESAGNTMPWYMQTPSWGYGQTTHTPFSW